MEFRAISTTCELDGKRNPLDNSKGQYPKKISQLLEAYRREDKPPTPKLAVPVKVVNHLRRKKAIRKDVKEMAIGDLCLIAFYYLLRVGEYTYHNRNERRRTKQFRVCDVTIWKGTKRLNKNLPEGKLIRHATAATLNISNQKNGRRQQTIHQEALGHSNCPVRAIIRRIKHIQEFTDNPSTMIGTWFNTKGVGRHITRRLIINHAVREAVKDLKLHKNGLPEKLVSAQAALWPCT